MVKILATIYTKQIVGWPKKEDFTRKDLIKSKKYKYTYTKTDLKEEEIIEMIEEKTVDISAQCFNAVDNSTFNKITVRLIKDKSPPQAKIREGKFI